MNGFLVLLERNFDSQAVALFATAEEAADCCRRANATGEGDVKTAPGEIGRPRLTSRPLFLRVIEFRNGLPMESDVRFSVPRSQFT